VQVVQERRHCFPCTSYHSHLLDPPNSDAAAHPTPCSNRARQSSATIQLMMRPEATVDYTGRPCAPIGDAGVKRLAAAGLAFAQICPLLSDGACLRRPWLVAHGYRIAKNAS
jgi:hypothetical protein